MAARAVRSTAGRPPRIREILESDNWANAKAEIPLALGRDVGGKPVIADLARMPHLLIAGATGSGKTVCINSIITSLLYYSSPDDLRFIMVDPKVVEMKIFNDLPHMLIPVVTDPKKVPAALRGLITEMETRYQIFGKVNVRNIAGFNVRKHLEEETPAAQTIQERSAIAEFGIEVRRDDDIEVPKKMPYIVCIIDELADLMMVAPADIENGIARLAQLARAAGIHLILATQRPSVNVITGVIKANLPCRIAFQVASKVDSRTILDSGGADELIGRGDLLFSPPGSAKLVRAQGCFVADDELNRVVEFLQANGPPDYVDEVQRRIDEGDEGEDDFSDESEDEMYPQALEVIRATRRASTSMLQRRLRIGYNRAARLMEELEANGVVGPENGSSPRDILVDLDVP
jgi:S-DNA-T family DNA segregation ATPase FtsK/SpoIIIE